MISSCCKLLVYGAWQAGSRGPQANGGIDPEPEQKEGFITATFDLDECRMNRAG